MNIFNYETNIFKIPHSAHCSLRTACCLLRSFVRSLAHSLAPQLMGKRFMSLKLMRLFHAVSTRSAAVAPLPPSPLYAFPPLITTVESRNNISQGTNKFLSIIGGFKLLPIYEIKKKSVKELKNYFHYRRISVTLGSVIVGFTCTCKFGVHIKLSLNNARMHASKHARVRVCVCVCVCVF